MSTDQITHPIPAPDWAVEQDPPSDEWPGHVMHRGQKHTWGTTSVWLERFDTPEGRGRVDVMIQTATIDYPEGETIVMPLQSAGETFIQLQKLLETVTPSEMMRDYIEHTRGEEVDD